MDVCITFTSFLTRIHFARTGIRPQVFTVDESDAIMLGNTTASYRPEAHTHAQPVKKEGPYRLFAFAIGCTTDQRSDGILNVGVKHLNQGLLPLLIVVNIFGNFYTQLVMLTMGHQRFKICYYAAVLALVNMCLMLLQAVDAWLHAAFGLDPVNTMVVQSQVMCNTFPFVYNFLMHLRAFLHVTMAVDTFLLSWRPVHYQRVLTSQRVKNTILIYFVILLTINSQFLWTYDIVRTDSSPKGNFCTYSDKWVDTNFTDYAWPVIDIIIGDILPIILIVVSIVLSIIWIRRHAAVASSVLEPYIVDLPTFKQVRKIFIFQNATFACLLLFESIIYISKLASFTYEKEQFNSLAYSIARSKIHASVYSYFNDGHYIPQMLLQYIDFAFLSLNFLLYLCLCPYFRKLFIEHIQCRTRRVKLGTKILV